MRHQTVIENLEGRCKNLLAKIARRDEAISKKTARILKLEAFGAAHLLSLALDELSIERDKLKSDLGDMRQERDDIQARLHAIDHAYCEQQNSENKLIRDQQETIRKQREFIRTLYTSRHKAKRVTQK